MAVRRSRLHGAPVDRFDQTMLPGAIWCKLCFRLNQKDAVLSRPYTQMRKVELSLSSTVSKSKKASKCKTIASTSVIALSNHHPSGLCNCCWGASM